MNHLNRSLLITSLLGLGMTAAASGDIHHTDRHWNLGLQGGIGWTSLDTQSAYQESAAPSDFYSNYVQELHDGSYKKTQGIFGGHVAYEFYRGDNSWQVELSANAGSGTTAGEYYVDLAGDEDGASIDESVKLKNMFNFKLNWKHFIYSDTYFSFGMGISQLNAENSLTVHPNEPASPGTHYITQAQTIHPTGLIVSMGAGFYFDANSSFDMGISYYNFGAKSLSGTPQLDAENGGTTPEYLRNRKNQISLVTLSVGYSHYF